MSKKNQNMLFCGGIILIVIVFIYTFSNKNTENYKEKKCKNKQGLKNGKCGLCLKNEIINSDGYCEAYPLRQENRNNECVCDNNSYPDYSDRKPGAKLKCKIIQKMSYPVNSSVLGGGGGIKLEGINSGRGY